MSTKRVFADDEIEKHLLRDKAYLFRMARDFISRGTKTEEILSENILVILDRLAAARYVRKDHHAQ